MRNNQRLRETVAANVRAELGRSRITQSKAAAATKISEGSLSKRLNGHIPFDIDQLDAIAALVGVDPSVLLMTSPVKASA